MVLPEFKYLEPRKVKDACTILVEHGSQSCILSGGTAVITDLRRRLVNPAYVVNIKNLAELDYVRKDDNGDLRIGALTTLQALADLPLIMQEFPALSQAAALVAVPPIRQMATIGGNLALNTRCIYLNQSSFWRQGRPACFKIGGNVCNAVDKGQHCLSVYQSDLAPVLVAMGARLRIVSVNTEKVVAISDFFTGQGEKPSILEPGELVTEVIVPGNHGSTSAYEKLRVREGMDFPLAGVAVSLKIDDEGVVSGAKLVLGAIGPGPVQVTDAATLMEGQKISDGLLEAVAQAMYDRAHPAPVLAMDVWYRRKMVRVLTIRAIRKALRMS